MPDAPRYQTHGPLSADHPLYVRRRADDDLLAGTLAGEFCYVLAPRQVGKSSLRYRTIARLQEAHVFVATANIQALTDAKTEAEWYAGVIDQLAESAIKNPSFALPFEWTAWWDAQRIPLAQRFVKFLEEALLAPNDARWVVTIDEIDASIRLPFTDSFFAAIRLCFDQRPERPAFQRLSIVLLGAATPAELIKDRSRTPFNIGRRVEMTDFTLAEAAPLAVPLPIDYSLKPEVLTHVLRWTGGQPHLTQKVCDELRKRWLAGPTPQDATEVAGEVERCVAALFFHAGILADAHFDYITKRAREFPRARQLLRAYRQARTGAGLPDEHRSAVAAELKIAGLVKPDATGTLRVANPIYARAFDEKWVAQTVPRDRLRLITQVAMAAAVLTLVIGYFTFIPRTYIEQLRAAEKDYPGEAYRKLAGIPGYKKKADELLAEYWDRRAARSEEVVEKSTFLGARRMSREPPDIALIYCLRALEASPTELRRHAFVRVVKQKLASLCTTFRDSDIVLSAAFSPDGSRVLTGSDDETVKLWDAKSGKALSTLSGNTGSAWSVAFSPDGSRLLTGSDNTARLWDAKSGMELLTLSGHNRTVTAVAFSPDGSRVLTGSHDNTARLWDAESGMELFTLSGHTDSVRSVAFSPDGSRVLTGSLDNTARLWDVESGKEFLSLSGHTRPIYSVAFSPDGSRVLTGSGDMTAKLWDAKSGREIRTLLGHSASINVIAFSPEGSRVLTGSDDMTAKLWDAKSGKVLSTLSGHTNVVWPVAFSPDGSRVLTGSFDKTARLWDVTAMENGGEGAVEEAMKVAPAELLERWLQRTALRFDQDGANLIPRYPLPIKPFGGPQGDGP